MVEPENGKGRLLQIAFSRSILLNVHSDPASIRRTPLYAAMRLDSAAAGVL